MQKTLTALGAIAAASLTATQALAWGAQGHQKVGAIGQALLNDAAAAKVGQILGSKYGLSEAAVWADCLRDVSGSPSTGYHYNPSGLGSPVCKTFGDDADEKARMEDYAARNWTTCPYAGKMAQCHLSFHFADVNVHTHSDYDPSYFGAHEYDVVQAIKAATVVLQCPDGQTCPVSGPFNIKDKKEALLMLVHFVGDVHQPLHVGAIYLTSDAAGGDDGAPTTGGNWLFLAPGAPSNNLHHSWDSISGNGTPTAADISAACRIQALNAPLLKRPAKWAGESVAAAKTAYDGLTFTDDAHKGRWDVAFDDKAAYAKAQQATQKQQVVRAGARLAEILNALWPGTPAAVCATGHHN